MVRERAGTAISSHVTAESLAEGASGLRMLTGVGGSRRTGSFHSQIEIWSRDSTDNLVRSSVEVCGSCEH